MPNKNSLTLALEKWFDKRLEKLPEGLRQRIERDVLLKSWNELPPKGRRNLAIMLDNGEYKETERRWQESRKRERELNAEIEEWKSIPAPTANDLAQKKYQLSRLLPQLAEVKSQQQSWIFRGAYDPKKIQSEDAHDSSKIEEKLDGHLNHNPTWQIRANEIAGSEMQRTNRAITKNKVAVILAKELGEDEATVLRRLRKSWQFRKRLIA